MPGSLQRDSRSDAPVEVGSRHQFGLVQICVGSIERIFDELICGVTVSELIESGSLSPYKYFATERSISVEGVGKRQGDFKSEDVAKANPVAGLAGDIVKSYRDYLGDKQAVIFCINVEHSTAEDGAQASPSPHTLTLLGLLPTTSMGTHHQGNERM